MLLVRHRRLQTEFVQRGITQAEAPEAALFIADGFGYGPCPPDDPCPTDEGVLDQGGWSAVWVDDPGTENERRTPVPIPFPRSSP